MNKNQIKFLLFIATILIAFFSLYLLDYRYLISKSSAIEDSQCLKVNPLIISRKNSYIALQKSKTTEEYLNGLKTYLKFSEAYLDAQEQILTEQSLLMYRWDYRTFISTYIKDASITLYMYRKADMETSRALLTYTNTTDVTLKEKAIKDMVNQAQLRQQADDLYQRILSSPHKDNFISLFIKNPASKCASKDLNIPDVNDSLNPETIPTTTNPLSS